MLPLDILLKRKSHNKLVLPAPTSKQVQDMMQAALRAPDHAQLKPWRYLIYRGESLKRLGEYFVRASLLKEPALSEDKQDRIANKPLRAPMVMIAIIRLVEHRKVPEIEQILSAGASVQNLIMAAHFMNIGAIWRTGDLAFNRQLMDELGLSSNESIAGFIYLGQEEGVKKAVPQIDQSDFVEWR